jgi:uncharacterized phage protein gp47/JayE
METLGYKFAELESILDSGITSAHLHNASGSLLDAIGQLVGLTRGTSGYAYTELTFTNAGENQVAVPSGSQVKGTNDNGEAVTFVTMSEVVVDPGSSKTALARALYPGAKYNVAKGSLTTHNVEASGLTVTNAQDVSSGSNAESDANFRARIKMAAQSRFSGGKDRLISAILGLPGVSDVHYVDKYFGVGTAALVLKTVAADEIQDQDVINLAQAVADNYSPFGVEVTVLSPEYVGVRVGAKLVYYDATANSESIKADIENALKEYVDNLDVGEEISLSEVERIVYGVSNLININSSEITEVTAIRSIAGSVSETNLLLNPSAASDLSPVEKYKFDSFIIE